MILLKINNHVIIKGCEYPQFVEDGYCNDETNNRHCAFDGGDCCYSLVIKNFCSECKCLSGYAGDEISHPLIGDGYCNDETNNPEYNYDGGDCCLSNVNTDRCSDCTCYLQDACAAGFRPPSNGDGFCNDETNNPHCYYDGLDCCRSPVNTELCSNCTCHGEYN